MVRVTVINKNDLSRKDYTFLVLPRKDEWVVLDSGDLFSVHSIVHLCSGDSEYNPPRTEIYVIPE
ncbi:hypothetical protein pEaSNUABM50_00514 [Erwinia phage pEa_SNUABM_50]|uniref:Uncharacterized protein n=4 Tax=Eneladusvirus BF TaxID=2560751 RepID=A0A7L8ZNC5_9CAUD|nr:hypothetical protein FDH34_gp430 [Serratia phage BF]QOI71459.1 hypothetical protein pEaSNUABM12_00542 [Erwinia phage pEa_SNUABM_12]QOI71964.1 hypothetical protein pEaSNUABM47_00515 [Erwinia phage pEa_SNUABM_47]QOI72504.1 hypothetical protein pEaSNUABM50_00514 [Erwinia phage pEa_SNUABM_50]QXO11635.1 hypothetical protein pEaSNUABM19_00524 [Erwinia phage pEa_SNUABM_19]QXO12739.1 hypothetical protein pEaSNUABM49_00526 [Erwinia phage pEa_SNUABM_49]